MGDTMYYLFTGRWARFTLCYIFISCVGGAALGPGCRGAILMFQLGLMIRINVIEWSKSALWFQT